MNYYLIDDGTLDTVFVDDNGREYRYNYDGWCMGHDDYDDEHDDASAMARYEEFVDWCRADLQENSWQYMEDE